MNSENLAYYLIYSHSVQWGREGVRREKQAGLGMLEVSHGSSEAEVQLELPDHWHNFLLISGFKIWGSHLDISAIRGLGPGWGKCGAHHAKWEAPAASPSSQPCYWLMRDIWIVAWNI